ncbi:InlB B-repeat-containing protein [bacterium]|nr:InlB B-repeat-containing protein [bacterium]
MAKKCRFLGILASLAIALFTTNSFAADYTCSTVREYTSCNAGYYLSGTGAGNSCIDCKTASNTTSTNNITRDCTTVEKNSVHATACTITDYQTCTGKYTSGNAGSNGVSQCTGCSAYTSMSSSSPRATACMAGYYLSGSTCKSCPDKSTSSAGNTQAQCVCQTGYHNRAGAIGSNATILAEDFERDADGCSASYTITYANMTGATASSSGMPSSYTYGTGATINGTPTKPNYTFVDWCTDSTLRNCNKSWNISSTSTGTKTYYAKWASEVTLYRNYSTADQTTLGTIYALNSGNTPSWYNSDRSGMISSITPPTRTGYTFNGYYTARSNGVERISANGDLHYGYEISGATNLYAQWTANCIEVKLDYNGGNAANMQGTNFVYTKPDNLTSFYGESACTEPGYLVFSNPIKPATREGYTFKGFYTAKSGGTQCFNENGQRTGNTGCTQTSATTLYAQWDGSTYDVSLDTNGGTKRLGGKLATMLHITPTNHSVNYSLDNATMDSSIAVQNMPTRNTSTSEIGTTYVFGGYFENKLDFTNGVFTGSSSSLGQEFLSSTATFNTDVYSRTSFPAQVYAYWRVQCSSGYYLPALTERCSKCPVGSYCGGSGLWATEYYVLAHTDQGKTTCPTGYTSNAGATSINECYKTTTAGNYIANANDATETVCPAGYYCPGGIKVYYGATGGNTACPAGTMRDSTGGQTVNGCAVCGENQYNQYTGQTSCTRCPRGTSIAAGGTKEDHDSQSDCQVTVYTIDYELNGGTEPTDSLTTMPRNRLYDEDVEITGKPTKLGYDFGGWCTTNPETNENATCAMTQTIRANTSTSNRTFYAKWTAHTYTIHYELNGGTEPTDSLTTMPTSWTYKTTVKITGKPTKTGYTFAGWCMNSALSGTCNIEETITSGAAPGDKTFYAKWSTAIENCQAGKYYNGTGHVACPAGKYCPGTGSTPIGTAGCATDCPTDSKGGTVTSAANSTSKDACYVNRTNVEVSHGRANQMCYITSGTNTYDKNCTISVTSCDAGYYREQANSTTCSVAGNGYYSAAGDLTRNACSALNGAASNVTTETQTSAANTACYNICAAINIENGTRLPVSEKTFFSGTSFPSCVYTTSCSAGYTASGTTCTPKILTITLNPNNGGANSTIYLKYATGWYSDAAATTSITSVTVPSNGDGMAFEGYTSTNNDVVVDSTGRLTTTYTIFSANATVTAQYGNRTAIHCNAGTYYTGTGTTCTQCPAGSYCPGVDTFVGVGTARGLNTCQSLNGTYTHADGAAATTISSLAGSTAATNCYATNLAYKSTTNNADGYQTCYYNAATKAYSYNCKDIKVTKCSGGHYLASAAATDCAEVGIGYYSPSNATSRTKCPFLDNNIGVKTFGTTSTEVTQCYLGNIWYVPAGGHSAHRRSCYHIDSATSANPDTGYSYNCDVSVIVTCDGGYYDDDSYKNTNGERDCIAVTDKDSYSPAQSYFTNEPAQPETPGSSTELMSCPATKSIVNGSTQRRVFQAAWTASDYAVCKYTEANCNAGYNAVTNGNEMACETCPANKFCTGGSTEPQSCPVDTATGATGIADAGAKSIEECYVYHDNYAGFQNGTASAKCTYSSATRGYTNCSIRALTCIAGYYYNGSSTSPACIKVGYGFWSPADDLSRNSCAVGETTDTDASSSASDCRACEAGYICDPSSPEKPKTCSELTNGQYTKSHTGTTTVDRCYRDCATAENAATMTGYDYYGIASTCEIDNCIAGYTKNTAQKICELCPAGSFCGGVDPNCPAGQNCDTPKTCASLGDGEWPYSDIGASGPSSCYRICQKYAIDGGTAVPENNTVQYPNACTYKGFDDDGNPCDIVDGKCIVTSCKPSFEMVNGHCQACNREHALSYKSTGNCLVESCAPGWHPYGQKCESDIAECSAPNAVSAQKQWNNRTNSYGVCTIQECADGYHLSSNACVKDVQDCAIEHGTGIREWDNKTNTWGECVATSCDPGFTNDKSETNEPTKQCGSCRNKFGVNGELAASSYSRECIISACMYQGEMYNLENNECTPICDVNGYEDETGTMKWNPVTHKCERTCKEGYIMW